MISTSVQETINMVYSNYDKYVNFAKNMLNKKSLAEDVVQSAVLRLLEKPETIIKYPKAYIGKAIIHKAFNVNRSEKKYSEDVFLLASNDDVLVSTENPENILIRRAVAKKFHKEVKYYLPKKQKEAFINHYIKGMPFTHKSFKNPNTAKAHWRLAALKIKKVFKDDMDFEIPEIKVGSEYEYIIKR